MVDAVLWRAVYSCDGSQRGFHVSVTWSLSTPRTAIDIGLSVDDTYHGVIVVHQVAVGNIS